MKGDDFQRVQTWRDFVQFIIFGRRTAINCCFGCRRFAHVGLLDRSDRVVSATPDPSGADAVKSPSVELLRAGKSSYCIVLEPSAQPVEENMLPKSFKPTSSVVNEKYGTKGGTQFWFVNELAKRTAKVLSRQTDRHAGLHVHRGAAQGHDHAPERVHVGHGCGWPADLSPPRTPSCCGRLASAALIATAKSSPEVQLPRGVETDCHVVVVVADVKPVERIPHKYVSASRSI